MDLNLIQRLLECIAEESQSGAVLIFLPGYDEIIRLRQMLERHAVFGNAQRFTVLPLHSACSSSEQRLVFRSAMPVRGGGGTGGRRRSPRWCWL